MQGVRRIALLAALTACSSESNGPLAASSAAVEVPFDSSPERFRVAAACSECEVLTIARLNLPETRVAAASAKLRDAHGSFRSITILHDGSLADERALVSNERRASSDRNGKVRPELRAWLSSADVNRRWVWLWGVPPATPPREDVLKGSAVAISADATARDLREALASIAPSAEVGESGGPLLRARLSREEVAILAKNPRVAQIGIDAYPGKHEGTPWASTSEWGTSVRVTAAHDYGTGTSAKLCVKEDLQPDSYLRLAVAAIANPSGPSGSHARAVVGMLRNTDRPQAPWTSMAPNAAIYVGNWAGYNGQGGVDAWCAAQGASTMVYSYSVLGGAAGPLSGTDMQHDWLAKASPYMLVVASAGAIDTSISNGHFVRNRGFNGLIVGGANDLNSPSRADDTWDTTSAWGNPVTLHGDYELPHVVAPSNGGEGAGAALTGTSGSAAIVAGIGSLIDSADSALKPWPEAKRAVIIATATGRAGQGILSSLPAASDAKIGAGLVDATAAARLAQLDASADAYGATTIAARGRLGRSASFASDFGPDGYLIARWKAKPTTSGRLRVVLAFDSTAACSGAGGSCSGDSPDADLDLHVIKKSDSTWTTAGTLSCASTTYDSTWEFCDIPVLAGEEYLIAIRKWSATASSTYLGVAWHTYGQDAGEPCTKATECAAKNCVAGACGAGVATPDGGSTPPVKVRWQASYVDTRAFTSSVNYVLENPRPAPVTVRISASAAGLDARRATKPLLTTTVVANTVETRTLLLTDAPMRSAGSTSDLRIEAEVLDAGASVVTVVRSPPLYYEADLGASTFTFYGDAGKTFGIDWNNQSQAVWRQSIASIGSTISAVQGTYWNGTSFIAPPPGGPLRVGQQATLKGGGPWASVAYDYPAVALPSPLPSSTAGNWSLCPSWVSHFVDAGFGEAYLNSKYQNEYPAVNAKAIVERNSDSAVLWSGFLDYHGCTPSIPMDNGESYTVVVVPLIKDGTSTFDIDYSGVVAANIFEPGSPSTARVRGVFLASLGMTGAVPGTWGTNFLVVAQDEVTNAATLATMLQRQSDNGLTASIYQIHAKQPRVHPAQCMACGSSDGLTLGTDTVNNAEYKYVIGHELGHVAQGKTTGDTLLFGDYAYGDAPLVCQCPGVPSDISAHCATSRSNDMGAQLEGYAHMYATRLFNEQSPTTAPVFVYYKERINDVIVSGAPLTILPVPNTIDPRVQIKWRDTNCPTSLGSRKAIERDYFGFFYTINTQSTAPEMKRSTLADIDAILRRTCNHAMARCVSGDRWHWQDIESSAFVHFGSSSIAPRYLAVADAATNYGVRN